MATITCNGESYTVDHAVKGTDYVHGYNAAGELLVSIEGIKDFSGITYSGTYISPSVCLAEACNDVKFCSGILQTRDGAEIMVPFAYGPTILSAYQYGDELPAPGIKGRIFFKKA